MLIRVWKPLPTKHVLKVLRENLEGKAQIGQSISTSGGLGLLQMVLEPDTGWCAIENARPPMGVDCEISHRLERRTKHCL